MLVPDPPLGYDDSSSDAAAFNCMALVFSGSGSSYISTLMKLAVLAPLHTLQQASGFCRAKMKLDPVPEKSINNSSTVVPTKQAPVM